MEAQQAASSTVGIFGADAERLFAVTA